MAAVLIRRTVRAVPLSWLAQLISFCGATLGWRGIGSVVLGVSFPGSSGPGKASDTESLVFHILQQDRRECLMSSWVPYVGEGYPQSLSGPGSGSFLLYRHAERDAHLGS